MHRLAVAEARLVIAKLLWNFDVELDGPHDDWVEDARFYVSSLRSIQSWLLPWFWTCELTRLQILWELQPLMVKLTPAIRS